MQEEAQALYEVRSREPLQRYSCNLPVRLLEALKRCAEQTDISQTKLVQRAVEAHLQKLGAL
jgi:hypothetical protein